MNLCIIQARENSTRLPNKVLYEVCGKTFLEHCYDRCNKSKADKIVIATTENSKKIQQLCIDKSMNYFVGSEDNVLDRYYQCAKKWGADNIVRITSDCPLIDPKIIDNCIDNFMSCNCDFLNNAWLGEESYPDGQDIAIISFDYLGKIYTDCLYAIWKNKNEQKKHQEHVLTWAMEYNDPIYDKKIKIKCKQYLSKYRWTLDYSEDLEVIKFIYEKLYHKNKYFSMEEILELYKQYPELYDINSKYARNESYNKDK
jgi:spore coat polysaccharide biosynthesis protein SpsF